MTVQKQARSPIAYSCYYTRSREGEQFVPEHVFSYQISGTLVSNTNDKEYIFNEGDFKLSRRNNLVKFLKLPPDGGEFRSISVYLSQQTLRNFSIEFGYNAEKHDEGEPQLALKPDVLYKNYMDSLLPYTQMNHAGADNLLGVKLKEAILLLLEVDPQTRQVLFDFKEPGKIDLEGFMNNNFQYNVDLNRFAYLTGRSLATFKRDFEKIFHLTPSRWLQQRRLQEAHYLIKEKGRSPSDIYLELGFEDLSHFSFAFKKTYGVAPSKV